MMSRAFASLLVSVSILLGGCCKRDAQSTPEGQAAAVASASASPSEGVKLTEQPIDEIPTCEGELFTRFLIVSAKTPSNYAYPNVQAALADAPPSLQGRPVIESHVMAQRLVGVMVKDRDMAIELHKHMATKGFIAYTRCPKTPPKVLRQLFVIGDR